MNLPGGDINALVGNHEGWVGQRYYVMYKVGRHIWDNWYTYTGLEDPSKKYSVQVKPYLASSTVKEKKFDLITQGAMPRKFGLRFEQVTGKPRRVLSQRGYPRTYKRRYSERRRKAWVPYKVWLARKNRYRRRRYY